MKFCVSSEVFKLFPELLVGILVVKNCDNSNQNPEIVQLMRKTEKEVLSYPNIDPVNDHPKIAAVREAHRTFGNNPKKNPPSVQSIVRRVIKGGQLPSINPLVDLYNIISLKHIVPAGGEDIDACGGDIVLARAGGSEEFIELGSFENNPPEAGEVVYKDEKGVICRKMNWREGERTKLTEHTKNAVLVIEALPPVSCGELESALSELKELVLEYCGGETGQEVISVNEPKKNI